MFSNFSLSKLIPFEYIEGAKALVASDPEKDEDYQAVNALIHKIVSGDAMSPSSDEVPSASTKLVALRFLLNYSYMQENGYFSHAITTTASTMAAQLAQENLAVLGEANLDTNAEIIEENTPIEANHSLTSILRKVAEHSFDKPSVKQYFYRYYLPADATHRNQKLKEQIDSKLASLNKEPYAFSDGSSLWKRLETILRSLATKAEDSRSLPVSTDLLLSVHCDLWVKIGISYYPKAKLTKSECGQIAQIIDAGVSKLKDEYNKVSKIRDDMQGIKLNEHMDSQFRDYLQVLNCIKSDLDGLLSLLGFK
jgi:hypothetical protein